MKKESTVLRILLIGAIVILLTIPNFMVQSLINERHQYRLDAINEIGKSWAGAQVVAGPVISVMNKKEKKDKNGNVYFKKETSHYLPEKLEVNANVQPEVRYKGIYELVIYKSKIKMKGEINLTNLRERFPAKDFDETYISFNVSDLRGIQKDVKLKLNGKNYNLIPGLKNKIFKNGFYADIQYDKDTLQYFEIEFDLNGMENLEFIPLGKYSEININSPWSNPSFFGSFLPTSRIIKEDGFKANWRVNYFNRTYPQEWHNVTYDVFPSAFGVKLLIPVDEYQKTMRMSKYSLMIIVLTFLSFFLVEVFSKKIIHPIQYLLVGLALIIFYSILLSVSEYIVFDYSYLISSLSTITLISLYVMSIYRSKQIAAIIAGLLFLFYGFMYVILQLQDYSLLLGNIALFTILALVMFFTRKINWYDVFSSKSVDG